MTSSIKQAMDKVDEALAKEAPVDAAALTTERSYTHGPADKQFATAQAFKNVIRIALLERQQRGMAPISPVRVEALEQGTGKMSRILWGDDDWPDHWDDICGYSHLGKTEGKNG